METAVDLNLVQTDVTIVILIALEVCATGAALNRTYGRALGIGSRALVPGSTKR
jgi:hypothetical protein